MELLKSWYQRTFSNPQVVILALFIISGILLISFFGQMLAPVFASLIIAYLLEAVVGRMEGQKIPRLLAVIIVFSMFLTALVFLLFGLGPLLTGQLTQLVQQIPNYISQGQELLNRIPELYPQITTEMVQDFGTQLGGNLATMGQALVTWSLSSVVNVVSLLVFLVLVPILVFFFMKDKARLIQWMVAYLPKNHDLAASVWSEVDGQIGNYVRGKSLEIIIIGSATFVTFSLMGLQYSALLSTLVGFSVLIPYIGAAVVTLPVAIVAFFQFGWGWDFGSIMIAYGVIQAIDGNLLVPLLFSEVVNLHPIAIIVAILIFGGLWGFWGVFFAIPLATVVNAVLRAWPVATEQQLPADETD